MYFPLISSLLLVLLANILVFALAYKYQTDKLTDITYSAGFFFLVMYGLMAGSNSSQLAVLILSGLVIVWAFRLGFFLMMRIKKLGRDKRFDKIRVNRSRFFRFFLIQGFGTWIIALPILIRLFKEYQPINTNPTFIEWVGISIATIGLLVEIISDHQKSRFKSKPGNASKLYTGGLYGVVRYPNYLGEILFWVGVFVACSLVFSGLDWLSILGPICISYLLLFLSGIPYIEKGRKESYGADEEYKVYLSKTKKIIPGIY